jgi:chromosome segregation ATPase
MSKPEITLETLYDILQIHSERFDQIDKRFDQVDHRFEEVDKRFDGMDKRFEEVDRRFGEHDRRFDSADSLQSTIVSRLLSIESRLDEHSAILNPLRERIESLHGLTEKLLGRVDGLDQEYGMITAALRRLETRFDQLEADRIRERISALESRVSALESPKS